MKELEITQQQLQSTIVLHVEGAVDSNTAPELQAALLRATEAPTGSVELDLAKVSYMSSAGQTRQISELLTDALAVSHRPILMFLTHCHQDHSQESALQLPAGTEVKRFAHQSGVDALKNRDRNLTTAYLYPWNPEICTARFEGILFAATPPSKPVT